MCGAILFGLAVGVTAALFQSQQAPSVSGIMGSAKAGIAALVVQGLSAVGRS